MNCLAVWEKYNPQIFPVHFRDRRPTADAAVLLNHFTHWIGDNVFDPLQANHGTIRPISHCLEVAREFHADIKSQS